MQIRISENLKKALNEAKNMANKYSSEIGTEHVLYGLAVIQSSKAGKILLKHGINKAMLEKLFSQADEQMSIMGSPPFTARVNTALNQAFQLSLECGKSEAKTEFVLLVLLKAVQGMAHMILRQYADINAIAKELMTLLESKEADQPQSNAPQLPGDLADLGCDLTKRARENKIDPVIGRDEEIERIIQILCRKTKNNPVLIGEPGVGKTAVVEGLARKIVLGQVPEILKDKILFSLDIASIVAGTKYRGAMEEKLKAAISVIMSSKNIIVFVDELHTLAQSGGKDGEVSPADILKPYLARGEMQTIGATTIDEYRKYIEKDKALERRFQPVIVEPPNVFDTINILKGLKSNYEAFHKVELTYEAIEAAVKLSDRYIMDRFLPDKAIDLIDEAMSKAKVSVGTYPPMVKELEYKIKALEKQKTEANDKEEYERAANLKNEIDNIYKQLEATKVSHVKEGERSGRISYDDIAEVVAKWTKIPVNRLNETESVRLVNLEKILGERVIGQERACETVAKAIRRNRAGLGDPDRPIGTFLFLGPTGVGKTELTKALSAAVMGDENAVIRMDMSEYMESHSVAKLIGSPPGYVGFDEGGQLTEQIRRRPYSIVLFDEIEKAHTDVYNILLQLLDDGRLTDSHGRVVNFKNAIIIMTSNVGVSELKKKARAALGFYEVADESKKEEEDTESILMAALKRHFKPEFINRIDVISIFHHLSEAHIKNIVSILMNKVKNNLSEKNITLNVTQNMIDFLVKTGYDKEYGARPLKRTIVQYIEDPLAESFLSGKIKCGDCVAIDYKNGKVVLDK